MSLGDLNGPDPLMMAQLQKVEVFQFIDQAAIAVYAQLIAYKALESKNEDYRKDLAKLASNAALDLAEARGKIKIQRKPNGMIEE